MKTKGFSRGNDQTRQHAKISLHDRLGSTYTPQIMSQSILLRVMSLAGWLLLAGCQSVESPSGSVVTSTQQRSQNRMQKFDPFPDTRIGPRVAGLRPPGYRKQISEPARSRQQAKKSRAAVPTATNTTQVMPPAK